MSAEIPEKLKHADITGFALRAAQLQQFKPVIAYWCNYWVVNQILSKGLHTADEECLKYTTELMDKLEKTKAENAANDAIVDDVAGQAYVEQFAQETFDRAQRAVKANKVTRQTADTFLAAATFFQLVKIWGPPDAETNQKILYAKFHASRIFKAIKEGKDPNESNPKQEEAPGQQALPALDPHDPEVQLINAASPSRPTAPKPVSVESVPDDGRDDFYPSRPAAPPLDASVPPAQPVSAPTSPLVPSANAPAPDQVSPIAPPDEGYFPPHPPAPSAPTPSPPVPDSFNASLLPPSAPPTIPSPGAYNAAAFRPTTGTPGAESPAPSDYYLHQPRPQPQYPPPPQQQQTFPERLPPSVAPLQQPLPQRQQPPHQPDPRQQYHHPPAQMTPPPVAPPASSYPATQLRQGPYTTDEGRMVQAQKHAKWAISALNFEDTTTAVRELRKALEQLGAL